MSPKKDFISYPVLGIVIFLMASILSEFDLIPSRVMTAPRNSSSFRKKSDFEVLFSYWFLGIFETQVSD